MRTDAIERCICNNYSVDSAIEARAELVTIKAELAELARLRKLFDDAGKGEHNVLALVDYYQDLAIAAGAREQELRAMMSSKPVKLAALRRLYDVIADAADADERLPDTVTPELLEAACDETEDAPDAVDFIGLDILKRDVDTLSVELTRLRALLASGQCVDLERMAEQDLRLQVLDLANALEFGDDEEVRFQHTKFHGWLIEKAGVKA